MRNSPCPGALPCYSMFEPVADPPAGPLPRSSGWPPADDDALADGPTAAAARSARRHPNSRRTTNLSTRAAAAGVRRGLGRPAEIDRLLASEHLRRHDVVAAERAAPHGVGRLLIAGGHQVSPAANDSAEQRVHQLGRDIENVAEQGAGAVSRARPVDVRCPAAAGPALASPAAAGCVCAAAYSASGPAGIASITDNPSATTANLKLPFLMISSTTTSGVNCYSVLTTASAGSSPIR